MNTSGRNSQLAMALLIGMIAYGSLYPFAFHAVPDGIGPFRTLLGNWDETPGRGDFISNILLYMPLGFVGAISVGKRAGALRVAATISIGAVLSFSMESLQYYDWGRDPQSTDFYANTLGTILGATAGWLFGRDFKWPLIGAVSVNRVPALLLLCWMGYRLYPYVPTINLHKYWDSLKPVFLHPVFDLYGIFRQAAVWLTLAMLIEKTVGQVQAPAVFRRFAGFILLSSILVISTWISISQLAGMAAAYVLWRILARWPRAPIVICTILLGAYVTTFRLEPFTLSPVAGRYGWTPFLSFMLGSIDLDVQSFFEKFFLYGGLIWLLAEGGMPVRRASILVATILFVTSIVEIYIPGRSAEVTDAVLALAAGEFIRAVELGPNGRPRPVLPKAFVAIPRLRLGGGRSPYDTLTGRLTHLPDAAE